MTEIVKEHSNVSITRACRVMQLHKSQYYYVSRKEESDQEVMDAIRKASEFGDGFWNIYHRIRKDHGWNHKRVYRVYKMMHYNKRSRLRKRLPARVKQPLHTPGGPCQSWSIDFVSDSLSCGRKFRVANIIDDFNREAVGMEAAMSITSSRLIRMLEMVIWEYGKPKKIRTDNGPEFISKEFEQWCKANEIEHQFTQPGCPTQNAYIERFNGSYRRGVLDAYIFRNLAEVREITEQWRNDYNNKRPHTALGNITPAQAREKYLDRIDSPDAKLAI